MDTRVALISIIVENNEVIDDINRFLHEAGKYIIGRMGIPYREKGINIISIAFGSQPICITFIPFSARAAATLETVVDFPMPPFPYTATLIISCPPLL